LICVSGRCAHPRTETECAVPSSIYEIGERPGDGRVLFDQTESQLLDETAAFAVPSSPAQSKTALCWPALAAVFFWSCMGPFAKWALEEFPTLAYTALRPLIAVLILFSFLLIQHGPVLVERRDLRRFLLAGTVGMGLSQFFYIAGLSRTSVSHNVILISCSPLLAAGYQLVFKRERLDRRSLIGVMGGFLGVVLLVSGAGGSGDATLIGDLLSLCGALTWMLATILPAPLLAKYGTMRTSAWLLAASMLGIVPISLVSIAHTVADPPSALAWLSLVYGGVFGILAGNSLWQRAVHEIGPGRTLIYLYLEPVGAMILAALFLGERLSAMQAIGGLMALGGVALVRRA
jgi:drug/metabolite transporter (DMT)-like permease